MNHLSVDSEQRWKIRPAKREDWGSLSRISREISLETDISDYINEIGSRYLETGKTYLLESEEIIGFQKVQELPDDSLYLSGLRIKKKYRRKGAATKLIQYVLDEGAARGKMLARSLVEPGNTGSLSLVSNFGFKRLDLINFFTGTVDLTDFQDEVNWPKFPIDLGYMWVRPYPGIPSRLLRRGTTLISISQPNEWAEFPTFTILSKGRVKFERGKSLVNVPESLAISDTTNLEPFQGFERAFLLELDQKVQGKTNTI